jgi:hypothetical protein
MKKFWVVFISLSFLLLLIACGGGGNGGNGGGTGGEGGGETGGGTGGSTTAPETYTGYYIESSESNPEDPTAGALFLCLPSEGNFSGQFLFSYVGCSDGIDVGTVTGTKTQDSLSGSWTGTVDGFSIGGGFDGASSEGGDVYSGTWTNSGGKQLINANGCQYYVAAYGSWTLYSKDRQDFAFSIQDDTFSWDQVPNAGAYLLIVYDKECMCTELSFEQCMMWQVITNRTSITYGEGSLSVSGCVFEIMPERQLQTGKEYIASLVALSGNELCTIDLFEEPVAMSNLTFTQ